MPLNEEEQRILAEIERQFHAEDPDSARRIGTAGLYEYLVRNCKWASAGLVVGMIILVAAFASSWVLGIFGFLLMVASGFVLAQNLRRVSRLHLDEVVRSSGSPSLGEALDELRRRIRRRLADGDEP
ncbi:MAG TPA: DUF3040 domain-containing protein [Acidimicrobiales bacterium]|nr:DUF3040 domain-containing protein [Acidimicrobiales bacterium]